MPSKLFPTQPDRAITFAEAEVTSGIPQSKLRQYGRERRLEIFRFGRSVFVSQASLLRLMESCRQPAVGGLAIKRP